MMGNGEEEPERKRRNRDSADAVVLQYQNQKLVQQLDAQKSATHDLEEKLSHLKSKQIAFDETLMTVNRLWNLLEEDLILLLIRAGDYERGVCALEISDELAGLPSPSLEETFLWRLLGKHATKTNAEGGNMEEVARALESKRSATLNIMKSLQETIDAQWSKTEKMASYLHAGLSAEDAVVELRKVHDALTLDVSGLHRAIHALQSKHKEYAEEMKNHIQSQATDELKIKRLAGELEENVIELEESRRKLVNLSVQKDIASGTNGPLLSPVNGNHSPHQSIDRTKGLRELKESLDEAKILAANRLLELQEALEENMNLSKQLRSVQNEMKDEKLVLASKLYNILNERVQYMKSEVDRYKGPVDALQAEKNNMLRKEKELATKSEAAEALLANLSIAEAKIEELEIQLKKCLARRNELELQLEDVNQKSGRKDIKSELGVMTSAMSKEMEIMETQLNRSKEIADQAQNLREEVHSLKGEIEKKNAERLALSDKCSSNVAEIKSLQALIEKLKEEEKELQMILEMYGQDIFDKRTVMEIKDCERRARAQADMLKVALDEHGLELRVRAANEAEAACQQRLSAAESEIADLREKLDALEREILELKETIRVKDEDGEAYISEIEIIGQAYEDMQMQNQRLQQLLAQRDDYNIKLVSESVKIKQTQSSLQAEKQSLTNQLLHGRTSLEYYKLKAARSEEQLRSNLLQAAKSSQENRHTSLSLDRTRIDIADAEKEIKWLKAAIDSSEKEYEQNQRKLLDYRKDLENEREEAKSRQEQLEALRREVAELEAESGQEAIEKLQEEIKGYKGILKCGVCYERPKEVVITKCYHLFCSVCIQRNLEIRHRKCPGCGTAFGQNDVRPVNI